MSKSNRASGTFVLRPDGSRKWSRKYAPESLCPNCGDPSALGQTLCHDCHGESHADYIPTPEQIQQALDDMQKDWGERERHSRAGLEYGQPVQMPTMKDLTRR